MSSLTETSPHLPSTNSHVFPHIKQKLSEHKQPKKNFVNMEIMTDVWNDLISKKITNPTREYKPTLWYLRPIFGAFWYQVASMSSMSYKLPFDINWLRIPVLLWSYKYSFLTSVLFGTNSVLWILGATNYLLRTTRSNKAQYFEAPTGRTTFWWLLGPANLSNEYL